MSALNDEIDRVVNTLNIEDISHTASSEMQDHLRELLAMKRVQIINTAEAQPKRTLNEAVRVGSVVSRSGYECVVVAELPDVVGVTHTVKWPNGNIVYEDLTQSCWRVVKY